MTPELKTACEVVFQEHKSSSYPVTWSRDAFRGRLSTLITEMAKDTLIRKKIIQFPNSNKKIITVLNPAVQEAHSFEEAEMMIAGTLTVSASERFSNQLEPPGAPSRTSSIYVTRNVTHPPVVRLAATTQVRQQDIPLTQYLAGEATRWYLKPVFVYGIWPICAAIAGGCIAYLMGAAYTGLVFDLKD